MRTPHDSIAPPLASRDHELGPEIMLNHQRPVSLRGKVFCGVLAGVIVITVSSALDRTYDVAEASGAAQVMIAEAEAEANHVSKMMRGASGMASAKHDWVFDH